MSGLIFFLLSMERRIFDFFALRIFVNAVTPFKKRKKQWPILLFSILLLGALNFLEVNSMTDSILIFGIDFLFITLALDTSFKNKLKTFFKYELIYYCCNAIIVIFHIIITFGPFNIPNSDSITAQYILTTESLIYFLAFSLFFMFKKLSPLPNGKLYIRYMSIITFSFIVVLTLCSTLLQSTKIKVETVLPIIFCSLLIIIVLVVSLYYHLIEVLENNVIANIELEKNALLQDYYLKAEENLDQLSRLRHDFKNHLVILGEYGNRQDKTEFNEYLQTIQEKLVHTTLIKTASPLLSALLNTKAAECEKMGIPFTVEARFPEISISDFDLVTIMGNILDNAITATNKCEQKNVELSIVQIAGILHINCKNTHCEKIQKKNDHFLTTKTAENGRHGLGIQNVKTAVLRLQGEMNITHDEHNFEIQILLPNH